MGDRSMRDCLAERLVFVHRHLASAGTTADVWYDAGQDFDTLDLDPIEAESFANAWGYLQGAADMADLTVMELLSEYGLSLVPPAARTARPRCPKCNHGVTHRCKTGTCRHCNRCQYAWHPKE